MTLAVSSSFWKPETHHALPCYFNFHSFIFTSLNLRANADTYHTTVATSVMEMQRSMWAHAMTTAVMPLMVGTQSG